MASVNESATEAGTGTTATATTSRRDPERTRENILQAALAEFADKGLGGARVDEIAQRAGANKRMLYHYFGNKEDLFLAVLERAYERIRGAETQLHLTELEPVAGMRELIRFTFNYLVEAPYFIRLLNSENLHQARHLKQSKRVRELHSEMLDMIGDLLRRGAERGDFRDDVDPTQLFISITGVCYFYFSNIHTLSTIMGADLSTKAALQSREAHAIAVILGYLRP